MYSQFFFLNSTVLISENDEEYVNILHWRATFQWSNSQELDLQKRKANVYRIITQILRYVPIGFNTNVCSRGG